jgi:hypothetical protein
MALSFLYLAFVRFLQLLRLRRTASSELAVEVAKLRHEVAACSAASWHARHCGLPTEPCSPNSVDCSLVGASGGSLSGPRLCPAGIETSFGADGPVPIAQVDRASRRTVEIVLRLARKDWLS